MKEKLVLVGNGMAGARFLEELLALAPDRYDITVVGAEPHGNYNRILLSQVLSGEKPFSETVLNPPSWYASHGIRLVAGDAAVAVDRQRLTVRTAAGASVPYDRLVLATGAKPVILPLPGADLPGVVSFRTIADVDAMLLAAREHQRAVVIGGGLMGLEAASGLAARGMEVTVVHAADWLMEKQLDETAGIILRDDLRSRGINVQESAHTTAIEGSDRVTGVVLADGTHLPADLVLMAVGIRPNTDLAARAGLLSERGIVVNEAMRTSDPNIYALGECCQFQGETFGMVAPLFRQAKVLANQLGGCGMARYSHAALSAKLKVSGIHLYSAGDFMGGPDADEIVLHDRRRGVYKKLVLRDDRIAGILLYGDTSNETWYYELMKEGSDISAHRDQLLTGQGHLGDAGRSGAVSIATMADDAEVCGCNGVTKGSIVNAITSKGLFTLEEVRSHTKASASCGSCTGLVEQILAATLGSNYSPTPKEKPLCACTDHTHAEVRRAIREQHLVTIPAAMAALSWKTVDGCPTCRPALNYYCLSTWPAEAKDDPQSREHNERVHANIQSNGTYSIVPRTWGGLTNAKELKAIADIAERMGVPVKITGGQRLAIPFVKKEDLPKVWGELNQHGIVSGFAYGKAVRSVKSCVGTTLCRFGTQDSLGLGIKLEQLFWGAWTPHKFKMGVSGCPRNCAESTIKDFGAVGVDSGWELHVGGTCGVRVRATDLLCKVKTADEVIEYAAAFIQVYREEGFYRERSSAWIERVGLPYVKQRVVDDQLGRTALSARFFEAQKYAQQDPWVARSAGGEAADEYAPLAEVAALEA